ncbi:hypothetical protein BDZ90DRAFT_105462 [Jaminaea rosea]|uniref:Uncharacterized protein n=1 Tax=Jaminaea rosea TaxID=1569628 RepID=A0A316UVJ4_9BASI|nr:hypothetical protein BDZ90DRAFT_105462 [Jaminaea rosea]PWN29320.1 hypothetical protein BDZ90DRAFT_105462 [Jaminaea rosea]
MSSTRPPVNAAAEAVLRLPPPQPEGKLPSDEAVAAMYARVDPEVRAYFETMEPFRKAALAKKEALKRFVDRSQAPLTTGDRLAYTATFDQVSAGKLLAEGEEVDVRRYEELANARRAKAENKGSLGVDGQSFIFCLCRISTPWTKEEAKEKIKKLGPKVVGAVKALSSAFETSEDSGYRFDKPQGSQAPLGGRRSKCSRRDGEWARRPTHTVLEPLLKLVQACDGLSLVRLDSACNDLNSWAYHIAHLRPNTRTLYI